MKILLILSVTINVLLGIDLYVDQPCASEVVYKGRCVPQRNVDITPVHPDEDEVRDG